MSTVKIATLNINSITEQTSVGMLADFIRQHDFDILFVQEVMSTEFGMLVVMKHISTSEHPYVEWQF